jgi:hypothetical protein
MKNNLLIVLAVIILIVGAYIFFHTGMQGPEKAPVVRAATYSSSELGIAFDYTAGPDGYVIQKITPEDPDNELLSTLVIMRTQDIDNLPEGGESPPTITMHVLKNVGQQQPQAWADTHAQYSNINLKTGEIAETVVGGANAIRYMADGLYASDNTVVAHGDNIYVISGMFISRNSDIKRDYQPLLDSIRFATTSTSVQE